MISWAVTRRMQVSRKVLPAGCERVLDMAAIGHTITSPTAAITSMSRIPGNQVSVVGSNGRLSPMTRIHEVSSQQEPKKMTSLCARKGVPATGNSLLFTA